MKYFVLAFVLLMIVAAVPVNAKESEYGIVNATFNGQDASTKIIEGVKLKVGEPVDINVTVTSKIEGSIFVKLTNPLVTIPYDFIDGKPFEERYDNIGVQPGWSKTFTWKIKPNDKWTNGNAPINVFVQFNKRWKGDEGIMEFTVADPIILNEQYSASAPQSSISTETPETDSAQQPNAAPFPYIYIFLIGAAIIVIFVLFKLKK